MKKPNWNRSVWLKGHAHSKAIRTERAEQRAKQAIGLQEQGLHKSEIARKLGISERQVYRLLAKKKGSPNP